MASLVCFWKEALRPWNSMSRFVDIHEYMPVLIEILREGKEVSVLVSGTSMTPFLADKRDTVIVSPPDSHFRRGDIVFYQRSNGQYIMHRVHHVGPDNMLYIAGDGENVIEGPVEPFRVFGVVRKVIRKGKQIDGNDFWWWFFEKIWVRMVPLRPLVRRLYTWIIHK